MAQGSKGSQVGGLPQNVFPIIKPGNPQKINFNATSQASAAFQANVTIVQLFATEDCYIEFGATPVASATTVFLPGGFILYYNAVGGEKIAAIADTVHGILHIVEGSVG